MSYTFKYDGHTLQTESDSDWAEVEAIEKYKRKKYAEIVRAQKENENFIRRIVREEISKAFDEFKKEIPNIGVPR